MTKHRIVLVLLTATLTASHSAGAQTFYGVSPNATYLRTTSDNPAAPTIIPIDMSPGESITLTPTGQYAVASGGPSQSAQFWAVFSSSNTLLPNGNNLNRVPGAIDVGALDTTALTAPSFYGNQPMDIFQDFLVPDSGLTIKVPDGAHYMFVAIPDSYLADNSSADPEKLGVWVTTPEPSSMALLVTGLFGLVPLAKRRQENK